MSASAAPSEPPHRAVFEPHGDDGSARRRTRRATLSEPKCNSLSPRITRQRELLANGLARHLDVARQTSGGRFCRRCQYAYTSSRGRAMVIASLTTTVSATVASAGVRFTRMPSGFSTGLLPV